MGEALPASDGETREGVGLRRQRGPIRSHRLVRNRLWVVFTEPYSFNPLFNIFKKYFLDPC